MAAQNAFHPRDQVPPDAYIDNSELVVSEECIGKGASSSVYGGTFRGGPVAINLFLEVINSKQNI